MIVHPLLKKMDIYIFSYRYNLDKDEFIKINYKFKIIQKIEEVLYRQQSISIPSIYYGGFCNYKFIIPEDYIDLGLSWDYLEKDSENIYYYNHNCPYYQINDVIRLAKKKPYGKFIENLMLVLLQNFQKQLFIFLEFIEEEKI